MSKNIQDLEKLVELYEDKSAEAKAELNEMLRGSQELRTEFATYLVDEELLKEELKSIDMQNLLASDRVIPIDSLKGQSWSWGRMLLPIAALLLISMTITYLWQKGEDPQIAQETDSISNPTWIAKLENSTSNAEWKSALPETGLIEAGAYELLSGEAILRFSSDVELVVRAPAKFDVKNNLEVILHEGTMRAKVSERGYGFVIDTSNTKVRDLGTEFGVSVNNEQQTEVHVFNGEVELYNPGESTPVLAQDGFAARWDKGSQVKIPMALESEFPTSSEVKYKNWKEYQKWLAADPSFIARFDFTPESETSVLSNKQGNSEVNDGVIHHPTWVQGRWSQHRAILFDSDADWISLDLPSMRDSFTIQTWVKPDRFDQSLQVILNSDTWDRDRHHWQITNNGELRVGICGSKRFGHTSRGAEVEIGKWTQLTMTYDKKTRLISYYVNDKQVGKIHSSTGVVDLGKSQIGCWRQNGQSSRAFRGRMDEFTLRSRCLTNEEIAESYMMGKVK